MPTLLLVLTPQCQGDLIIKENLAKGRKCRYEDTSVDEEGESELTELLNTPKAQKPDRNVLMKRQQGVPKNAAIQPMQSARPTMSAQEQGRTTSGSMPGVLHLHTLAALPEEVGEKQWLWRGKSAWQGKRCAKTRRDQ